MFELANMKNINRFKVAPLTAILLLIAGFSILLYTTSAINGYAQLLDSRLTVEELWSIEDSLRWWSNTFETIFPITLTMITAGLITLFCSTALNKIQQKHAIRTFTHELELASKEKFEID